MPKSAKNLVLPQQQDNSQATYTKILTKQDGKIIWDKTAQELERQIRAYYPWPGSFTVLKAPSAPGQNKSLTLKILKAGVSKIQTEYELGQIFLTDNKELAVQTGQGCLIIEQLQAQGGKEMSAADFLNGHPEIVGTILQ
jgi:methionyl-tRNA formyltransferase